MTREELVKIVARIMKADGNEHELEELERVLSQNVPHPAVSELIFYPPNGIELSAEEIVDRALAYEPMPLGPGRAT